MTARPPRTTAPPRRERPVLITGGAGFVGTNLADRLAEAGRRVIVYDNLSRAGVERNLAWLRARHGDRIEVRIADIRDRDALRAAVAGVGQVFHFAAQVAVTTSLTAPAEDMAINIRGTLGLLEAVRASAAPPALVFTSTNKVYGALEDVALETGPTRYAPAAAGPYVAGVDEKRPLDFHSPYGCSKGAADQYVLDYARSYGLDTVVFRMSCIYGPHQFGTEDQGWVAHFLLRALGRAPITLYGDGRQVRDILHVDDLVDAFLLAEASIERLRGQAFNIGGGPANAVSLLELLERIERLAGRRPETVFAGWRTGDQRYYVSNHGRFTSVTGWRPKIAAAEGIGRLYAWLGDNRAATDSPWRVEPVPPLAVPAARRAASVRETAGAS
jgi:CDP-paratose 2-epimerase